MKRIALGLNLAIEKLDHGWCLEFSGGLLVLHWSFVKVWGKPGV